MIKPTYKEMLEAGVHFGHLKRKWNPKMTPYIFQEHKGIHLIDLNRTSECLERAGNAMRTLAKANKKILFVATKKQARVIIMKAAQEANMPFVTERWLGGMMTNFTTIRNSVKKMKNIERMLADTTLTSITKKERLTLDRERIKMDKQLGGIENLNHLPHAMFIVDIHHEHLALAEAKKLGIRTFGMVDTNSDPTLVDFPIPSNDDSSKSISLVVNYLIAAIKEGNDEGRMKKSAEVKSAE
jgi:small subunit ribosomal protein S2